MPRGRPAKRDRAQAGCDKAEPPATQSKAPKVRKVNWVQRVIDDIDSRQEGRRLEFDIVDGAVEGGEGDGEGGQDEAEADAAPDIEQGAVEAQAAIDGNLDDVVWLSATKETQVLGAVEDLGKELVSKAKMADRVDALQRKFASEREASSQGAAAEDGEEGEEAAMLQAHACPRPHHAHTLPRPHHAPHALPRFHHVHALPRPHHAHALPRPYHAHAPPSPL